MGFLKKKKHNIEENIEEAKEVAIATDDEDDFNVTEKASKPTRDEFHKMAEDTLMEAISNDGSTDENITEAINENTSESIVNKEKFNFGVSMKNFGKRHKKGVRAALISIGAVLLAIIALYVIGCCTLTPSDVMGRNVYIENVDVSGLTYDEALAKVQQATLLDDCELKLICRGKAYMLNGNDAKIMPKYEETVDLAMRYGKTGNILIDGLANTLQYFFPRKVLPMATIDEAFVRQSLAEFGVLVYGELSEHSLELGDGYVTCTPGKSGFSGDVDDAYADVVYAINNENYSGIHVSLKKASPKDLTYETVYEFVKAEPVNASYKVENGETTIVPEEYGRELDREKTDPLLQMVKEGGNLVNIPYEKIEPKLKSTDLNGDLFNTTLASYTTSYYAGGNRGQNVAIAASKINNVILLPGEVFSFNDIVGPRSRANGFLPAEEYSNGETVIGIGGGTCQVSTTLYNAVLYSDLKIVYRLNHMFAVGYAPLGQDATVSDTGVDFKFQNNTDHPIKITSVTGGGKITVSIIGTARDVKHEVKIENITSYVGADRSVRSYRYVYDPSGNLLRKDDLGKSYYMSHHKETPAPSVTDMPAATDAPQTDVPVTDTPPTITTPPTPVTPQTPPEPPVAEPPQQAPSQNELPTE